MPGRSHRLRGAYDLDWLPASVEVDGRPSKRLLENSALRPGERREVKGEGERWRLRYHYGSGADEAAGRVPLEDLVVTLREG